MISITQEDKMAIAADVRQAMKQDAHVYVSGVQAQATSATTRHDEEEESEALAEEMESLTHQVKAQGRKPVMNAEVAGPRDVEEDELVDELHGLAVNGRPARPMAGIEAAGVEDPGPGDVHADHIGDDGLAEAMFWLVDEGR